MSARTGDPITFFFDENVSHRLREYLVDRGHEVILAIDHLAAGTADQIVASVAVQSPMVLVTHDRDFHRFKKLLASEGQSWIARGSGKLQLSVHQSISVQKVDNQIALIEFYYRQCVDREITFYVEVKDTVLRIVESQDQ